MIYHYYMNDNENKLIPASTVLIIRNGKAGIEVFMVVRHHEIDFASGALVFPGGKVDRNDYDEKLKNLSYIDEESESENLFARKRYTLDASSLVIERNSAKWNNIMTSMEKKFGETIVFLKDLTDFSMFELVPSKSLLVYGFGKAFKFSEHNFEDAKHLNETGHTK